VRVRGRHLGAKKGEGSSVIRFGRKGGCERAENKENEGLEGETRLVVKNSPALDS